MLLFKIVWFFLSGICRVILLGYLLVVCSSESTPVDKFRGYVAQLTIGEVAERVNAEIQGIQEALASEEDPVDAVVSRLSDAGREIIKQNL